MKAEAAAMEKRWQFWEDWWADWLQAWRLIGIEASRELGED